MKLIRWIVVGGVVLMLLPSDEQSQAALTKKAVTTAHYASTTCERHPDVCSKSREMWASLKKKAEFAGRVLWNVAFESRASTPNQREPVEVDTQQKLAAPKPSAPMAGNAPTPPQKRETRLLDGTPKRETGTLRTSDRAVPWQGNERLR